MKKQQRKITNCYSISSAKEGCFAKLQILIQEPDYGSEHRTLASITWQSDDSDFSHWYALHVKTDFDGYRENISERLQRAAKLISKLLSTADDTSPEQIIAALESMKLPRVEYDRRLSRNITAEEFRPGARYMDDWSAYGYHDGCSGAALGETEEEAQREIQKKWAERIANGGGWGGDPERFAKWIAAGKPVRLDGHASAPTFRPLHEILFQKAPEEATAHQTEQAGV